METTDYIVNAPVITQEMLAEVRACRRAFDRYHRLRTDILNLVAQGAEIEPGPLRLRIDDQVRRTFTHANLTAVLGENMVEMLRQEIEPTRTQRVMVEFVQCGHEAGSSRGQV